MRYFERAGHRESLDAAIASVARAYGFTAPPVAISKKDATEAGSGAGLVALVASKAQPSATGDAQVWGVARAQQGAAIVYTIAAPRHAIAQAFVVKSALATAEAAGFSDLTVLVSSVGDHDSRRRYAHELGNFFRKHAKEVPIEIKDKSLTDPTAAARELTDTGHALAETLPRTIDHLSEPSRKIMLETIALLEALDIKYELAARLPTDAALRELVFAIDGTDRHGNRVRIASGGRVGDPKAGLPTAIGIAVILPDIVNRDLPAATMPSCYVLHVGEAAKVKAFGLLESLWRARIALGQALLLDTIGEQMQRAQDSGAKYLAIVGQREALDGTVIVRNLTTQLQETMPAERVPLKLARARA